MNSDTPVQQLIKQFGLLPHPEGGHYRETYRGLMSVKAPAGPRAASTAIYYLLEADDYSAWHRIASDELWHFYAGSALNIYVLDPANGLSVIRLGNPLTEAGCVFQAVVPAGLWFAAEPVSRAQGAQENGVGAGFALVGCTVAPGFEFSEFELADSGALIGRYPEHAELIRRLAPVQR